MSEKVVGTFLLDGLIQGPLPAGDSPEGTLRAWVAGVKRHGIVFHLQTDGGSFSLLPEPEPIKVSQLGDNPAETVADALDDLLELLDDDQRPAVMSTIRSREYRPGQEVQTLYVLDSDGRIDSRSRTVAAETTDPPQPVSGREKVKMGLVALAVVAVVLGISTFFVDYRGLAAKFFPPDPAAVEVQAPAFDGLVKVGDKHVAKGGRALIIKLSRGARYPADAAAMEQLYSGATSMPARLAAESLGRGYVRLELFDADGKFVGHRDARVSELSQKETIELAVPLSNEYRLGRVVLVP
jgi:hypothetical protein